MKNNDSVNTYELVRGENVLPDDYPVNTGYVYIVDGVFTMLECSRETVLEWKNRDGVKEIRSCSLFARPNARLGDKVKID